MGGNEIISGERGEKRGVIAATCVMYEVGVSGHALCAMWIWLDVIRLKGGPVGAMLAFVFACIIRDV